MQFSANAETALFNESTTKSLFHSICIFQQMLKEAPIMKISTEELEKSAEKAPFKFVSTYQKGFTAYTVFRM